MKKILYILLLLFSNIAFSQTPPDEGEEEHAEEHNSSSDTATAVTPKRTMWQWKHDGVYRVFLSIDTSIDNVHNYNPIFKKSIANSYLAVLPSSYESDIFIDRPRQEDFLVLTSIRAYLYKPSDITEFNTTTPFTQLTYFTGGGKGRAENYLDVWHYQNIKRYWSIGMRYNLISSDGRYMNQKSKTYHFTLYSSYEKERLAFSAFLNQNIGHLGENGGITNKNDLTNSDLKPDDIPSFLAEVQNSIRSFNFNTTLQYNIGNEKKTTGRDGRDSITTYPLKATLAFDMEDDMRRFKESVVELSFFPHTYIDSAENVDLSEFFAYKLRGKLILNEHPKYAYLPGIYAGIDYDHFKYKDRNGRDTLRPYTFTKDHGVWLSGGMFNVDSAALFQFDVKAKICLFGDYLGDFGVEGFIRQYFNRNKNSYVHANATLESKKPNHFYNHYNGNHDVWSNNFSNTKKLNVEAKYVNEAFRTEVGLGFNNFIDYIYMDTLAMPQQSSKVFSIMTAWAKQTFRLGHFYFNQTVYAQKSTDEDQIALPLVALYSHNYYKNIFFKKVLGFSIGFDLFFNSKFYADSYAPSTMSFYQQRSEKTGGYPKFDVFMDLHIKRANIFVKYEHVNFHLKKGGYFTTLNYPINPAMLKFGIRWNFFD